ncbi:MAG: hypothetical protein M1830_000124 [Pleopsidium flavum]|nr:MAG: hypothetical protein M1830_000124 [Pleopsidium flavum]
MPINPDTLITVKVAINGSNRRFKLALRDLGANVLPDKLRFLLAIPPTQAVIFERFSDSAGAYTTLDSNNPSVYKQLYRAAKAKLKLRIKATVVNNSTRASANPSESLQEVPTPADRLDSQCYVPLINNDQNNAVIRPNVYACQTNSEVPAHSPIPAVQATENLQRQAHDLYLNSVIPTSAILEGFEKHFSTAEAPPAFAEVNSETPTPIKKESVEEAPVPRSFSARESFFAELASMSTHHPMNIRNVDHPFNIHGSYSVFCNECDHAIPGAHYHCSICDDGDFDLCQSCVDSGVLCGGEGHWLIKRVVRNGKVINSTTETIAPKSVKVEDEKEVPGAFSSDIKEDDRVDFETRTCNSCVGIFHESNFVTCTVCEDYDLCIPCLVGMKHGHHPSHGLKSATEDASLSAVAIRLCAPGRNMLHFAVCDGCDKHIYGVRHKCMNCPDWDFCSTCIKNARHIHPGHRFVPIYEIIAPPPSRTQKHHGIFCDGPLCKGNVNQTYIVGDRYKCAVCHDTDFCANCEAIPTNRHNRTHPLIKFKTPVRNVSVTTLGEKNGDGGLMTMGDVPAPTSSKATETNPAAPSTNAGTQVQTFAEVKPSEPTLEKDALKEVAANNAPTPELHAHFIRDAVADGSKLPPNQSFEQVWTLRNPGPYVWPAGCSVRFIGGDNMLNVDLNHPASVSDIAEATESNVVGRTVAVDEEIDFRIVMKTPQREGKSISYWRLKAADGTPFGHKLWCDIDVCTPEAPTVAKSEHIEDVPQEKQIKTTVEGHQPEEPKLEESTMIFPKLDKESPVSSTHEISQPAASEPMTTEEQDLLEEVESLELEDGETDDGFLTDEEYDILDASDEEFVMEAQKAGIK